MEDTQDELVDGKATKKSVDDAVDEAEDTESTE